MRSVPVTAEINGSGRINVTLDYRLRESIKRVPGARWSVEERVWSVPLSWPACLALRAEFGTELQIGEGLKAWAKGVGAEKKQLRELRNLLELPEHLQWATDTLTADAPGFADLYPYQKVGATLIAEAGGYMLLDEPGVGKTRSALAGLALSTDPLPCLIIAPKSMLQTWGREILGFFPEADVRLIEGTPTKQRAAVAPGGDFYIIN